MLWIFATEPSEFQVAAHTEKPLKIRITKTGADLLTTKVVNRDCRVVDIQESPCAKGARLNTDLVLVTRERSKGSIGSPNREAQPLS
jgi:hypothetical protein